MRWVLQTMANGRPAESRAAAQPKQASPNHAATPKLPVAVLAAADLDDPRPKPKPKPSVKDTLSHVQPKRVGFHLEYSSKSLLHVCMRLHFPRHVALYMYTCPGSHKASHGCIMHMCLMHRALISAGSSEKRPTHIWTWKRQFARVNP